MALEYNSEDAEEQLPKKVATTESKRIIIALFLILMIPILLWISVWVAVKIVDQDSCVGKIISFVL